MHTAHSRRTAHTHTRQRQQRSAAAHSHSADTLGRITCHTSVFQTQSLTNRLNQVQLELEVAD
jgi:hypothetical protein